VDLIAALRSFLRVAEIGSFSAVAAERGVTQPAVSRQVGALEQHFGTRLVQRSTHAVALTEEGRDLIAAAQQLVDAAEALQDSARRRRGKPVGRVRLAVPVPLGLYLSCQLGRLLDRHEELSIDLVLRDGVSDLIEEGLDLQVWIGAITDSSLISRRIGSTTAFLVAAPRYLSGRTPPSVPHDLTEHECIVYHRWGRDDVWWFSSPEGEVPITVKGRLRTNNAAAVHRAVLDGRGIALMSHLLVANDIREGQLHTLMPAFPPVRFPLYVAYPSRRNLPARTRIVIDFLAELLHADPASAAAATLSNSRWSTLLRGTSRAVEPTRPDAALIPVVRTDMNATEVPHRSFLHNLLRTA
jgi:DNA-binding transcriptional LysR family regulator